jgi:hypothetical protein
VAKRTKVCTHLTRAGKSCPNLQPCPEHPPRDRNARWSRDRDPSTQARFRAATLARDGYTCTRCGHSDRTGKTLDAHHITPERGVTLCNSKANGCHAAVDRNAR